MLIDYADVYAFYNSVVHFLPIFTSSSLGVVEEPSMVFNPRGESCTEIGHFVGNCGILGGKSGQDGP